MNTSSSQPQEYFGVLNKDQIKEELNKTILIHPFREENLKYTGYNLRASPLGWSVNKLAPLRLVRKNRHDFLVIEPNDVGLVMSREAVGVSNQIAGTFHSKVDKVSIGLSHVSTTLDPNWVGPLLIAIANNRNVPIELRTDDKDAFVTLIFYKIKPLDLQFPPPKNECGNEGARTDILRKLGIQLTPEEDKWCYADWRRDYVKLQNAFSQNFEDKDTHQIKELKISLQEKKRIKLRHALPYFILIASALIGWKVFGNAEGMTGSIAIGIALFTHLLKSGKGND